MDKIDNNYSYDYSILCELCEYCPYKSFGCRPSYYVSINGIRYPGTEYFVIVKIGKIGRK